MTTALGKSTGLLVLALLLPALLLPDQAARPARALSQAGEEPPEVIIEFEESKDAKSKSAKSKVAKPKDGKSKDTKPPATKKKESKSTKKSAKSAAASMKVKVVGLQVTKPLPSTDDWEKIFGHYHGSGEGSFFDHTTGTRVTLLLSDAAREFVRIDEEASKVHIFADDKGTNLAVAPRKNDEEKPFRGFGGFGTRPLSAAASHDRRFCAVRLFGGAAPADGAARLRLKADLMVKCGEDEATGEQADVVIAQGTAIAIGPLRLEIAEVGQGFGDGAMTVTISGGDSLDEIKQLTFLDSQGTEVPAKISGRSTRSINGVHTRQIQYSLSQRLDDATIRAAYFKKVRSVPLPIDITVSLGL